MAPPGARSWRCAGCTYTHASTHTACFWCDKQNKAQAWQSSPWVAAKWVDYTAGRGQARAPRAAAALPAWQEPPWQEVTRRRARFTRGADLSLSEVQAGRLGASTAVGPSTAAAPAAWSSWATLATEDDGDEEEVEAEAVAFQGPTPAEAARELRGQQRQVAQCMLASVRSMPRTDVTQTHQSIP